MPEFDFQNALYEREWRKCAPDWESTSIDQKVEAFEHWCRKYVYIRFPGKGKIPFELRDAQRDTVRLWLSGKYTVALKARQIGFSTLVSIYCFWLTFFYPDRVVILISKTERDSQKLLNHAKYAYRFMPQWMKSYWRAPVVKSNQSQIEFSHESVMESLPSAADPARGNTAFVIVVDEFGQLPNDEEAWSSIEPVADQGGRIVMLGTANGVGNLFHDKFINATGEWVDKDGVTVHKMGTGANDFKSIFHGWWTGGRDDDWYESKRRNMQEHELAQEYPSNPDEAFLKSGRPVFDLSVLKDLPTEDPVWRGWHAADLNEAYEDFKGPLCIWDWPKEKVRYSIGVDVAEGLEWGDFSSVHVINSKTGRVVAHWHGHIDTDLLATDVLIPLGRWYNRALILVEANNHGLTTLTALKREGYHPLFRQRRLGKASQSATESLGWRTTVSSKPLAIDELNQGLRDGDLILEDARTIAELRTYVRDERGRMAGSPHDDRVMSLAIAYQGLKYVHNREYVEEEKLTVGSVEWHMQRLMGEKQEESTAIGRFAVAS